MFMDSLSKCFSDSVGLGWASDSAFFHKLSDDWQCCWSKDYILWHKTLGHRILKTQWDQNSKAGTKLTMKEYFA